MNDNIKYTHFDKDGKLQQGLPPNPDDYDCHCGSGLKYKLCCKLADELGVTRPPCPDCARLKALVVDVWSYIGHRKYDPLNYEKLEARITEEGIE